MNNTGKLNFKPTSRFIQQAYKKTVIYSASPLFSTKTTTSLAFVVVLQIPHIAWTKFSIIFPKTSPLAELLIRESHLRNLHSGPKMTLFAFRQTIWIPGGIASVKKVIHSCNPYIRFDDCIRQPLMGDLPAKRRVESFAFLFTGIDYCGPFYSKDYSQKL